MKFPSKPIVLLYLLCMSPSLMAGGGRVGNAGDWRRIMLDQAQREASNWVNTAALNAGYFASDPAIERDSPLDKFIRYPNALKTLATDIIASEHVYSDETSDSDIPCAWTNDPTHNSLNDIAFALNRCEDGLKTGGIVFANRLMIHESVHHLLRDATLRASIGAVFSGSEAQQKQKEEMLCDAIAAAVNRVFELVSLSGKPHWRDIEAPYFEDQGQSNKAFEARGFHSTIWTGNTGKAATQNRMIIWGGCQEGDRTIYACGDDRYFNDGAIFNPSDSSWTKMTVDNAPSPRAEAAAVWTGSGGTLDNRFIVWGGCTHGDGCEDKLGNGGIFDPAANTWTPVTAKNDSPEPRAHHSAVWSGSKLIIWGGHPKDSHSHASAAPLQTGGMYDPITDSWEPLPINTDTPSARAFHTAIWTGSTANQVSADKMLIFGGCVQEIADDCPQSFADGAFFDPLTKQWSKLNAAGPVPKSRHNEAVLYVPSQARLYIYGGLDSDGNVLSQGSILDLKDMRWLPMASVAEGRFKHKMVWAGDKILVFGGKVYNTATRTTALADTVMAFVPQITSPGRWLTYHTDEMIPLKTFEHSAVWTGDSLLVWGGQVFDRGFTNTGSQFFPGINIQ